MAPVAIPVSFPLVKICLDPGGCMPARLIEPARPQTIESVANRARGVRACVDRAELEAHGSEQLVMQFQLSVRTEFHLPRIRSYTAEDEPVLNGEKRIG